MRDERLDAKLFGNVDDLAQFLRIFPTTMMTRLPSFDPEQRHL